MELLVGKRYYRVNSQTKAIDTCVITALRTTVVDFKLCYNYGAVTNLSWVVETFLSEPWIPLTPLMEALL
jgi:hypothetical protein